MLTHFLDRFIYKNRKKAGARGASAMQLSMAEGAGGVSPDWKTRRPPPRIRAFLPVLTWLRFKGADKYLEDLVSRIDAPQLDGLTVTFFHSTLHDSVHQSLPKVRRPL
jgi:hypothetical protein